MITSGSVVSWIRMSCGVNRTRRERSTPAAKCARSSSRVRMAGARSGSNGWITSVSSA